MLNLKKGLALVLAAATALTFAPLTSLNAKADIVTTDGLTTTAGVDSIENSNTKHLSTGTSQYDTSAKVELKEHFDHSQNGTAVTAYKITINRQPNATNPRKFEDVVQLTDATTTPNGTDNGTIDVATATKPQEITPGGTASSGGKTPMTISDTTKSRSYIILNTANVEDASNGGYTTVGRTAVRFYNSDTVAGTVQVTVSSLSSADDPNSVLDTSTFDVTVPSGKETFALQDSSITLREGETTQVGYTIEKPKDIKYISIKSDNEDVANYKFVSTTEDATTTDKQTPNGTTDKYGTFTVVAGEKGVATLTVEAKKGSADTAAVVAKATLKVTVTAVNGKLSVTYNALTSDSASKKSVKQMTYTDSKEYSGSANAQIQSKNSITKTVNDGKFIEDTVLKTDPKTGYPVSKNGKFLKKADASEDSTTFADGTDAKSLDDFTAAADGTSKLHYDWYDLNELPAAQTLYADNDKTKTVQITASSDENAKITYSLVAYDYSTDSSVAVSGTTATTTEDNPFTAFHNTVLVGGTTPAVGYADSTIGQNSKMVYTERAAKEYGSISKDGLVTLKGDGKAPTLYVIVTAEKGTSSRDNSTFVIPIEQSTQAPVSFYASDSLGFAELETSDDATGDTNLGTAANTLYLSLSKRPTDKLNIVSNVDDGYITGSSSDDSIIKYDDNTRVITAVKAGEADITLKTLSAPQYAGIVTGKIHVVVNDLDNQNAPSLKGVSVNKAHPTAKVESSSATGLQVIFDKTLYKKDASRPTGYSVIKPTESGYQDVLVSSTGNIVYNKNNGTVYARAYVAGDNTKHNPSTYNYVEINYGQTKVANDFKVDLSPVQLKSGETKNLGATASTGSAITYTSADSSVATVSSDGTITAVKPGVTQITVQAAETSEYEAASAVITVVVSDKDVIDYKNPAQVKGVKLGNKKGAKVVVKFTKDTTDKNIKYYVQKKVGKKTSGKSVGSNRTILSVKKGATVKVRVKAYYYDANGIKHVGKYSKWVTKKTDKK